MSGEAEAALNAIAADGLRYLTEKYGSGEANGLVYVVLVSHKDNGPLGFHYDGPQFYAQVMLTTALLGGAQMPRILSEADAVGAAEEVQDDQHHENDPEGRPARVTPPGVTEAAKDPGEK